MDSSLHLCSSQSNLFSSISFRERATVIERTGPPRTEIVRPSFLPVHILTDWCISSPFSLSPVFFFFFFFRCLRMSGENHAPSMEFPLVPSPPLPPLGIQPDSLPTVPFHCWHHCFAGDSWLSSTSQPISTIFSISPDPSSPVLTLSFALSWTQSWLFKWRTSFSYFCTAPLRVLHAIFPVKERGKSGRSRS